MCVVFVLVGVLLTLRTGLFQFLHFKLWWKRTIIALFTDKNTRKNKDKKTLSQFQALSTALAATIGTGNIVGVATALVSGGPGAVFWMWVSAFFGMMTKYAEIALSMKYRYRNKKGEYISGPMVFLEKGLGSKFLAVLFAAVCLVCSFGVGNMSQANSVADALQTTFNVPVVITGVVIAALCAVVIMGGVKRIGIVAERIVPFMAIFYIVLGVAVIVMNFKAVPAAFGEIFSAAFQFKSIGGGVLGYTVAAAMRYGVARGVFSNEAGLGSSAMAHSASNEQEPVGQAMWGIFEVFLDTIVVCTITALVILTTRSLGAINEAGEVISGAALTIRAFSENLGSFAGVFIAISIVLFAFASILGWSLYGERCMEYLFGEKYVIYYRVIYIIVIFIGCLIGLDLVWGISDIFNGLMAIPNLIGVVSLSGMVARMTRDYLGQKKLRGRRRRS